MAIVGVQWAIFYGMSCRTSIGKQPADIDAKVFAKASNEVVLASRSHLHNVIKRDLCGGLFYKFKVQDI